jgi:hypothetical protein
VTLVWDGRRARRARQTSAPALSFQFKFITVALSACRRVTIIRTNNVPYRTMTRVQLIFSIRHLPSLLRTPPLGPVLRLQVLAHPFPFIEWGYRTTLSPGKLFHFPPKPDSLGSEVLRANALPAKISRQGFPFLDNNVAQQRGITRLPFRKAKNASHSSGSLRRTERTANTRTCQPLYPSWLGRFYF